MPDPIKSLFEATKSKKLFLDEADFKTQLSKDPQGVFNAVSDTKLFIDFNDFENTLGLKKKEVSQVSGKPSVPTSPSELPLPSAPKLTYNDIEGVIAKAVNTGSALNSLRESAKGSSRLGIPGVPTSTEQFARAEAEYKSAMSEKDRILKDYAVEINKPVDNIIKRGESNLFFDGDVFDEAKARKHVEAVTAKYGGGPLLQEQMVANMRNRLVEEKTSKESKPFIDSALKKRGINIDTAADSVIRSITQPSLDRAKALSDEAQVKKNELFDTSKTRANELTNTFSSFVDGLNKQIEAKTMTVDQAKVLFEQEKAKYQTSIGLIDKEYRSGVAKMNANLKNRYSRIDSELKKLSDSLVDTDIVSRLPKQQQDAIKEAYLEGQGNYVNFKNEQRKEKDITAGWMMPFGQFTSVLGRGAASGFAGTLASFGDFLIKNGSSNDFSKWLSTFSTEQEKFATAKYDWSQPIQKFLSITGTTLGGSAPQMLLGGLAAAIPGAQPIVAATASGVISALSESAVEAGDEFSGALMKGKDVVVAKERADEIYKKNMSNAALYAVGGIGNYLTIGKGKVLKGFGVELAEELPLSVNQSYEKAVLDGYKKSKTEFIKENPDILVDTFVGTIGMSAAMGGVGKLFTPITNTVPSGKTQFLQEMVQKSGPDAAKAVLDMYANNGIIDENELIESKAKVDQLTINDEKLSEAGVTGDQSKIITALGEQEKDLKIKVQAEQDPAVKAVLQKQLSDLQKDVKGVLDNTTPYISFTLPGGGDMTRVMTVREFNAMPQEKQDQAIKSADKISVINDDAANTSFNEKKKQLGNQSADKGAYTNEVTEQPKVPAIQVDKPVIETNTLAEVDRVKALAPEVEDGATFDLDGKKYEGKGLIIPVLSENTTIEELTPQKIADFVEANKTKLGGSTKAGIYKFPNSNKVSIDLNIVVDPKYRDIGLEFGKKAGQESLFDLGTFENVKTGADGKNPIKFTDEQFSEISKALSEGKMPDVFGAKMTIEERLGGEISVDVDQKVEMAQKALDATGVKINMIDNTADFESAVAERKGPAGVEGVFISDTGEILINKELLAKGIADGRVIWHEASHPVINIVRNTNSQLFDQVIAGMQEAAKTNKAVEAVLNWAKDNYGVDGDGVVNDEAVVEMIANLAEGTIDIKDLPTGFKQAVIDFINKIAKALGFEPVLSDTDVAAFKKLVTQISDALTTGRDISEIVGAENVKATQNELEQLRKSSASIAKQTEDKTVEGAVQPSMVLMGKKKGQDVVLYSGPASIEDLKKIKPDMYISRAVDLSNSALVQGKTRMFSSNASAESKLKWADSVYAKAKETVVSNLLFLFDSIPSEIRDISKLWYDGANIIAQELAKKYNATIEQAAGVMASQSPQKPWYDNVHLAHFIMDFYANKKDMEFTQEMYDYYKLKSQPTKQNPAGYPKQIEYLPTLKQAIGKKFSDLSNYDRSVMIRTDFDNNYERRAPLRIPTGEIVGRVSSMSSFSGYDTIAKGISILENGSEQNISDNLGKAFKVRNFNNNISDPRKDGEVTIDTHAMAAAYLLPLGASSPEVKFDEGTYAFFADAYRDAAKQRGVLAREMQSIVWEGGRSVFPAAEKSEANKNKAKNIWSKYKDGTVALIDVQNQIKENGKDLSITDWSRFTDTILEENRNPSYLEELPLAGRDQLTAELGDGGRDIGGVPGMGEGSIPPSGRVKGQARKGNLVADAGLNKQMTSDDKGNYLFYHYSDRKLKTISPSKFGKNLATGRDERPGIGISMYYTRPDMLEANVPSDYGFVVRVPENKVYPFNEDPLDLLPAAEKAFNKKFPGQAFDFNKQVAFVTQEASKRGYPMTVAQWNIRGTKALRAQTTEDFKPEMYRELTPGTFNQYTYNQEIDKFKPNAKRRGQASRGRRDLDAKLKAFAQKERELGSTDQEIEQAIRNRFPLIDKARIDEIMAPVTIAQPSVEEKLETVVQPEGEEKVRGMEKRLGDLDEDTYNKIVDESKTYFSQPNKQTEKAAEEFMKGKSLEYMAEFVTSNPNIPGAVNVWMAAMTAKQLGTEIEAAKNAGDVNKVEMLSAARANIYNHFSAKATELGQTVQAFVSFKADPAANQFIFNKILKQLEEKGVTGLSDAQKAEIKGLLDDVSTAAAGLPKDIAITKLSHYLGKLTPISAFDIMQAMWYAKILSGITTQSKNFFANMVNTFIEVPVVAMRMSVQTGSLQPIFYAMKGLGGGALKGLVKAGDIMKSGVTSKAEDKFFNNDNLLEYFTWSDTKIGKGFGGAVGKVLDFPLFFETSPRALKFVGRSLTASDALFSTANQEAVANMLAFAQAKQEGLRGNVYNRVQQILNNTKQSVIDAKAQAKQEGFKPGTVQYKRRVIELVNQNRGEEIVNKAEEIGKRATLTNEPEGFTRGIYLMATKIQETMPISKVMIPFTRIVANVSEMMINFSPAGTYRALTGIKNPKFSFKFTPSGDNKLTNDQRADMFIKSMIGITALTVLANNVGDDEDDWFDITAGGPTDYAKKYELMKGGWRPYTITFKDGTKINYAEWPTAGAFSAIGNLLDVERYGNVEDPEWIDKMVIGAYGYLTAVYDKSLLKGISDFVDIFRPSGKYGAGSEDFIKRTAENTSKFAAQQAKAITLSNASQQTLKLVDEYKDNPIKEAKGAEVFYRDIPIINDGLNPIVDVFGDPVTYATTERLLPWMSVSDEKKDQVLAYLNRNNVFVGMAPERPMIDLDNLTERKMTRQELYEYRKLAGKYVKEYLYEYIGALKELNATPEAEGAMKKTVADFASAARDKAYLEIVTK